MTIKFSYWQKYMWFAYIGKRFELGTGLAYISKKPRKREYYVRIYGQHEIKDCTTRTLRKAKEIIREELEK